MSSRYSTNIKKEEFIERFIEVCGSSHPAEIARLLNISYQAAKNYIEGRLPDSSVLLTISECTPYSIHWLLTGQGEKIVGDAPKRDTEIFTDEMRAFIRRECLAVINEVLGEHTTTAPPKVVILTPEKIKEEKVIGEPINYPAERK